MVRNMSSDELIGISRKIAGLMEEIDDKEDVRCKNKLEGIEMLDKRERKDEIIKKNSNKIT